MRTPLRGEVYMVDLGLAAKVRPCVVISVQRPSLLEAARMAKAKRDIGLEILEGIREIKRGEHGRVVKASRPRRARTLLERARKYIGSVKGPLKPRNVAAQAKALVRRIVAGKHSR